MAVSSSRHSTLCHSNTRNELNCEKQHAVAVRPPYARHIAQRFAHPLAQSATRRVYRESSCAKPDTPHTTHHVPVRAYTPACTPMCSRDGDGAATHHVRAYSFDTERASRTRKTCPRTAPPRSFRILVHRRCASVVVTRRRKTIVSFGYDT